MSLDNCDLFSEEARKSLTKYKIYRPKSGRADVVKKVKTTAQIATEQDFNVIIQKEMPEDVNDDDIVATAMDLYLTINLTENLYNAKIERKRERLREEEESRLTKIQGFTEQF